MNYNGISVMSFTEVMDKTFNVHKKHIGTSALYLFLFNIIGMISAFVLIFLGVLAFGLISTSLLGGFRGGDIFEFMDMGIILLFVSIFSIIFSIILLFEFTKQVGIIDIASKSLVNKPVRFEKALGLAFKKIPATLSVIIAYGIIFIPITIVFGVVIFSLGIYQNFDSINMGIITLGICFSAVYIYLGTIFMFSINVSVLENLYFFKALKRSTILVKNSFWKLFGINLLFALVVTAVTYSIYSIFGIIGGLILILLKGMDINESTLSVLIMLGNFLRYPLQIIFSLFIAPLSSIFHTLLYYNQRFKKEGYDMNLKLEDLKEAEKIKKEKTSEISNTSIKDSNEREI